VQIVKAMFLRRRSTTWALLGITYLFVGVASWLAIRELPAPAVPSLSKQAEEAEAGGPPGAFPDSWRDEHSRTCRFEITWRSDETHPNWQVVDAIVTNVSGIPIWYHEWNRVLVCHPFLRFDRPGLFDWEQSQDPLATCGNGAQGDSWRRLDDGAQVRVSATWVSERSGMDVCFVVSFWKELKDGWIPKRPVDACSPVFRVGG